MAFCALDGGIIIEMYSGLPNELGVRKESLLMVMRISLCIVDTDSKFQEE